MTNFYMSWHSSLGERGWESNVAENPANIDDTTFVELTVVDIFCEYGHLTSAVADATATGCKRVKVMYCLSDPSLCAAIVRQGLIPAAPLQPTLAFTTRTMEMFRLLRLHCPRLAVQSFGRFLFDFQCRPIKTYLFQLSIAFDVYIEMLHRVRQCVLKAVNRDEPEWRIENCCPSCTYRLQDEPNMRFSMLWPTTVMTRPRGYFVNVEGNQMGLERLPRERMFAMVEGTISLPGRESIGGPKNASRICSSL